jgi:hypothetical protein
MENNLKLSYIIDYSLSFAAALIAFYRRHANGQLVAR